MRAWRKIVLSSDEEAWVRRLRFIDAQRIAISGKPEARRLRLEVYHPTDAELRRLLREWGGVTVCIPVQSWLPKPRETPVARVAGRIAVFNDEKARARWRLKHPKETALFVPAGIAFGSGDHATTGMALRRLARENPAGRRVLDAGTGTGILSLAARALGAAAIDAFDFDPVAIRVARENEALNFQAKPGADVVRWSIDDILGWKSRRRYDFVAANLFSELLIEAASRLWRATAPGGKLLLTGILKTQEKAVVAAYTRVSGVQPAVDRRGKWVLLCFERESTPNSPRPWRRA